MDSQVEASTAFLILLTKDLRAQMLHKPLVTGTSSCWDVRDHEH